jgi:flagellar hook-length control protein FliK
MSIIDLNQLIGLPLLDMSQSEPGAGNVRQDTGRLFDDYLLRAQSSSIDAGDNGPRNSGKDTAQSSAPRAEESHSTAAPLPRRENNDDNADNNYGAESAGKANLPKPESQQSNNKYESVGQEKASSRTNKEEEDDKKDNRDECDASQAGKNQNDQSNVQINPDAAKANSHSQSGKNTTATQTEIKKTVNSSHISAKGAKTTADSSASTKAESSTADASQTAGVDEVNATVSKPTKGKTSKNNALGNGNKAGKLSAEQASETTPVSGDNNMPAAKKSKHASAFAHNAEGKTAPQHEPSTAPTAEATVSTSVSQEATARSTAVNTAALQAVVNAPVTPTKPAEDLIGARTGNAASADKAADAINALPRLEQSAAKTSATTLQDKGDDARSDLNSVRFVQRVERAFAAMGDREGAVRLKLNPPELGSVRMEITINKGVMRARLEAETKEAKNMLLENLPALRDRLAQQNIKIQKFDVDLRDPSSGGMPQQTAGQADTGSGDSGYHAPRPQTRENNAAAAPTLGTTRLTDHNGQLNVIV